MEDRSVREGKSKRRMGLGGGGVHYWDKRGKFGTTGRVELGGTGMGAMAAVHVSDTIILFIGLRHGC